MGTVRSVQSYGVFVTLDESGISGLCHISMFADMHVKDDLANHVRAGERVRAKIMKVDYETNKVSLGIKASVFGDEDDDIDNGAQREGDSEDEDEMHDDLLLSDDDDEDTTNNKAAKMDLDEPEEEVENLSEKRKAGQKNLKATRRTMKMMTTTKTKTKTMTMMPKTTKTKMTTTTPRLRRKKMLVSPGTRRRRNKNKNSSAMKRTRRGIHSSRGGRKCQ